MTNIRLFVLLLLSALILMEHPLRAQQQSVQAVQPTGLDEVVNLDVRAGTAADIPIAQLSCQPAASPESHFRIGQALRQLRKEGVLILGSGTAVHNLSTIGHYAEPPGWAVKFEQWLCDQVLSNSAQSLLQYHTLIPEAAMSHPTPEHFLPLFVAIGAGSNDDGRFRGDCLHRSWSFGSISMAAYSFADL